MDANFKRERLNSFTKEQLIAIITNGRNYAHFPGVNVQTLSTHAREVLVNMIMNTPAAHVDNNAIGDFKHLSHKRKFLELFALAKQDPRFDPTIWAPKENQIPHIERIVRGLTSPLNEGRTFWDMSDTGLGKTITAILAAIQLGVRYLLIICPDAVISKWDDALSGLGLFDYRICTYSGIIGSRGRGNPRWARYKTSNGTIEDLTWLQIHKTERTGAAYSDRFDWSHLPGTDQYTGLGGCLVIWDEVQSVKNLGSSKAATCFKEFIEYLQGQPDKFIRGLLLSATVMEKADDLPFLLYALGYIKTPTLGFQNDFIRTKLGQEYQKTFGVDWRPEYAQIADGKHRLLLFLRVVGLRDGRLSQMEVPPSPFANPITFQGLQVQDDELAQFMRINKELETLLIDVIRGNKKFDGGVLGQIQRTLSELEVLKLTPFTEIARKALFTPLPNGAKGSVVIAMTRNASVRHFAWRLEAMLFIDQLQKLGVDRDQNRLLEIRKFFIQVILGEYQKYQALKPTLIARNQPLPLLNAFVQYRVEQLNAMSMEDLANEYNKWFKYIDVDKFEYVSIFVSDFGSANPTDFDLESEEEEAWVKEGKTLKRSQKEDAKWKFQTNQRRVFLTNVQISREGIDLHDTSGGEVVVQVIDAAWMEIGMDLVVDGAGVLRVVQTIEGSNVIVVDNRSRQNAAAGSVIKAGAGVRIRAAGAAGVVYTTRVTVDFVMPVTSGSHPRTGIISPGIVARYLEQMLGRFVRVGQNSETYRIVGYVANVKGMISWEAKFMEKLSAKISDLQRLHKGSVVLDIMNNIQQSGDSIFKEIMDELRYGGLGVTIGPGPAGPELPLPMLMGQQQPQPTSGPGALPVGTVTLPKPMSGPRQDNMSAMFQSVFSGSGKPSPILVPTNNLLPQAQLNNDQRNMLMPLLAPVAPSAPQNMTVKDSPLYTFYVTDNDAHKAIIADVLEAQGLPLEFFRITETGVLVFRPGFSIKELSHSTIDGLIANALKGVVIKIVAATDDELKIADFNPVISVANLTATFESINSIIVKPDYPFVDMLPVGFVNGKDLKMERLSRGAVRFSGLAVRVLGIYYASRMAALIHAPNIFLNFTGHDPNGVVGQLPPSIFPKVEIINGEYRIVADRSMVILMPLILGVKADLMKLLTEFKVLHSPAPTPNGLFSLAVATEYQSIVNKLLGRKEQGN